jgi:hypothetical protein
MKKIFYEKVGRRYVPVAEYDSDYLDSFPKGAHLVLCHPGGTSRRFNIDPNYAAMIAAGRVAEDAMCKAMNKASELRPAKAPITPDQQAAWNKLAEAFGDELATLHGSSLNDIAQAGVKAMQDEADKLMQNPNVRDAFDYFIAVCKLTKEQQNES